MALSKKLSILQQRVFWAISIVVIALIIAGISIFVSRQMIVKKFEPIAALPSATMYNLDLASADIKTAYSQLEQAYVALGKNPADADAALSRAKAYLGIKDTARAILAYQWINRQYPNNVQGWIGLADIYVMVGRLDDAKTLYQTALKLEPNSADIQNKINKLGSKS